MCHHFSAVPSSRVQVDHISGPARSTPALRPAGQRLDDEVLVVLHLGRSEGQGHARATNLKRKGTEGRQPERGPV